MNLKIRTKIKIKKNNLLSSWAMCLIALQFANTIPIFKFIDEMKLKHIFIVLAIVWGLLSDIGGRKIALKNYGREVIQVLKMISVLLAITFVYMHFHGFTTKWISELYFLAAPILLVYVCLKDDCSFSQFKWYVDIMYYWTVPCYLFFVMKTMISGIQISFSFANSISTFEQSAAHIFLLLYIFYTFYGERKKRIVTGLCSVLAWKRMCLLYFIFVSFVDLIKPRLKETEIPKHYIYIVTAMIALIPVMLQFIVSDTFSNWFERVTGLDFKYFTMFRFYTITTMFESDIPSQGLVSFMYIDVPWHDRFVHISPHNDILRLYFEVSIVGVVSLVYGIGRLCRNYYSFLVVVYLYIEMIVSHFLGNGGLPFWIIAYFSIFCFNTHAPYDCRPERDQGGYD